MYEIQRASCVRAAAATRSLACRALPNVSPPGSSNPSSLTGCPAPPSGTEGSLGRVAVVRRQRDLYAVPASCTRDFDESVQAIFRRTHDVHILCMVVPGTSRLVHALSTGLSTAWELAGSRIGHEIGVSKVTVR